MTWTHPFGKDAVCRDGDRLRQSPGNPGDTLSEPVASDEDRRGSA